MMLNWLEGIEDKHTRDGAVELQSALHSQMIQVFMTAESAHNYIRVGRNGWRYMALSKANLVMGQPFHGTVLEIGAGSGWASAMISEVDTVERVYCLDYDPVSVEQLMPKVHRALSSCPEKIERVLGSYNSMPLKEEVDIVVSIGAIHHAENLFRVLDECHKVLKPGGWLIASEHTYPDTENNASINARYKKEDPNAMAKYGRTAKHEENSDHYYRVSEYIAAAYAARFDVYPFLFDLNGSRQADDNSLKERKTATGFYPNVLFPFFASNPVNPEFDNLLLMLQKPMDGGVSLDHCISA